MKFKIPYDKIIFNTDTLGHVILNGIDRDKIGLFKERLDKANANRDKKDYVAEMEFKIQGIDVDPSKFFDILQGRFDSEVRLVAAELLDDKLSAKIRETTEKLEQIDRMASALKDELLRDLGLRE
jgi:hypothetical protein